MDFHPVMKAPPRLMDERIFRPEPMGLREELLSLPLDERFTYDAQHQVFYVNFEGLTVKTHDDMQRIQALVASRAIPP
jgi:propionate CoA-transferase